MTDDERGGKIKDVVLSWAWRELGGTQARD